MYKIICKGVPEELLDKQAARDHFRKFGTIRRIGLKHNSKAIGVEYRNKESMEKALISGNTFNNQTFVIYEDPANLMEKQPNVINKPKKLNISADVMAELDAMGGGPSLGLLSRSKQEVTLITTDDTKKTLKRRVPVATGTPKKNKAVSFFKTDDYKELLEITSQQAVTVDDKYKVLDARDKILRIILKENGAKKGFTKGTCPDMCPEKERLLRVIQHQISFYEQNAKKEMDPNLAIKQYSRSSADQESPLPHELRPVEVLYSTLMYLIYEILPLGDEQNVNLGEWFHFLWDRTRSIRKDITQQALCCPRTVEMLELCARFHIHCSARLVAEDPSVFDQKINTENLTKCLQTLKYMYNDLRLNGQECENEAEFRAYIILLNLNDANFMWEVQRLPLEIQQSEAIQEAITIYLALNSNNFVGFFKLVAKTSYLNACIMMRYFTQVRIHGLNVILKSYTTGNKKTEYPLKTLTQNLGFESAAQTIEFLQNWGLEINESKDCVVLDRYASMEEGFTSTVSDRCMNLVESKRESLTIGEIIFGKALPDEIEFLTPQSSFDEIGFLKEKVVQDMVNYLRNNETEETDDVIITQTTEMEVDTAPSEPKELFEKEAVSSDTVDTPAQVHPVPTAIGRPPDQALFDKKVEDSKISKQQELPGYPSFFSTAFPVPGQVYPPVTKKVTLSKDVPTWPSFAFCDSELHNPKSNLFAHSAQDQHVTQIKEKEMYQGWMGFKEINDKQADNSQIFSKASEFKFIDQSEKAKEKQKDEKEIEEEMIKKEEINKEEEERAIKSEVKNLLSDVIDCVLKHMKQKEKTQQLMERIIARKFVMKWKTFVINQKRKRTADELSRHVLSLNLKEAANAFSFCSTINAIDVLKFGANPDDYVWAEKKFVDLEKCASLLGQSYSQFQDKRSLTNPIYWKCGICLPEQASNDLIVMGATLQNCFQWSNYNAPHLAQHFWNNVPVRMSIQRQIRGGYQKNDSNGLIFIDTELNRNVIERIVKKFSGVGAHVIMPVALIIRDKPSSNENELSSLELLVKHGIISQYTVFYSYPKKGLINLVDKALQFLAKSVGPPPPIEVDYLENVLFRNFLCSEIWKKISCYSRRNCYYAQCLKNPEVIIGIYNDGLRRLKQIVLDSSCYEFTKFPEEFREFADDHNVPCDYKYLPDFSKDENYRNFLICLFDDIMSLENFSSSWPPENDEELLDMLHIFCAKNFHPRSIEVRDLLFTKMSTYSTDFNYDKIQWTDIMEVFIHEKYRQFKSFVNSGGLKKEWTLYDNLIVVYHKNVLAEFKNEDWFYLDNPVIQQELKEIRTPSPREIGFDNPYLTSPLPSIMMDEIKEATLMAEKCIDGLTKKMDNNSILDTMTTINEELSDLSRSMTITRRIASRFEEAINKL